MTTGTHRSTSHDPLPPVFRMTCCPKFGTSHCVVSVVISVTISTPTFLTTTTYPLVRHFLQPHNAQQSGIQSESVNCGLQLVHTFFFLCINNTSTERHSWYARCQVERNSRMRPHSTTLPASWLPDFFLFCLWCCSESEDSVINLRIQHSNCLWPMYLFFVMTPSQVSLHYTLSINSLYLHTLPMCKLHQ